MNLLSCCYLDHKVGTYRMKTEEQLRPVVFQAIREGYRLIGVYFANNKGEKAEKAESFEILKG